MTSAPMEPSQSGRPRLLVLSWSQTGQLSQAAHAFVGQLENAGWSARRVELRPANAYPFPWSPGRFFSVFPETVAGPPSPLAELDLNPRERFDLIVLAYQVWFLAPSPPVQALFDAPAASILAGTPVVTLVACRNMWYSAAARLRRLIDGTGARFAGVVAAIDRSPAWATFVMTPRWLMTGRTDRWMGMPSPGIGEPGIAQMRRAGARLARRVEAGEPAIIPGDEAEVDATIALADRLGGIAFGAWARTIRRAPAGSAARIGLSAAFVVWLATAIVIVLPIVALGRRALGDRIDAYTLRWVDRAIRPMGDGSAS